MRRPQRGGFGRSRCRASVTFGLAEAYTRGAYMMMATPTRQTAAPM